MAHRFSTPEWRRRRADTFPVRVLLVTLLATMSNGGAWTTPIRAQAPKPAPAPSAERIEAEKKRIAEVAASAKGPIGENGIAVGRAKIFDNRSLTLMLENLSETLRGLNFIDQDPIKKALGLIQGSQTTDVSRSASILAGGTPQIKTTSEGTSQADLQAKLTNTAGTDDGKESESVEELIDRKVSEKLGLKQESTSSERNPALPTLPDLISSPSGIPGFGQHPADLLTDQVNLTYQILNLRMVLERSLSDRITDDGKPHLQAVLGFNVSIDPPRDAENSAAVVEVTVRTEDDKPVSLVAVMPQEKTYNAVAMNTKSTAFGGSAVAGMFTVGYNERRRGQVFYLYRDNDTLSFERMLTTNDALTFGWQFRPVLGRKSVSPGMRQMFAVISTPMVDDSKKVKHLKVSVRTYWRKYYGDTLTTSDRKDIGVWPHLRRIATLGLSEAVPNNKEARRNDFAEETVAVPTTKFYQDALQPTVDKVAWTRIDDKTALITVGGTNFFSGTTVAMGGTAAASGVVIKSSQAMDIVTPIENIGAGTAMLIGRYGVAQPLRMATECRESSFAEDTTLGPALAGQRELRAVVNCPLEELDGGLVLLANGKPVPGTPQVLRAPHDRTLIVAQVPAGLVPKGEAMFAALSPFRGPLRLEFPWYDDPYKVTRVSATGKTIVLIQRRDEMPFDHEEFGEHAVDRWKLEYGGTDIKPSFPALTLMRYELASSAAEGTVILYEPSAKGDLIPYLLELPPGKPKPKVAIEPAGGGPLVVNQNAAPKLDFTGERVAEVATVRIEGREALRAEYDPVKAVLTVWVSQETTKLPASALALQFRDAANISIATIDMEVKALPRPGPAKPTAK